MSKADPDQQSVYYAERLVFENTLYDELVTDSDIHALAEELFCSDWWQANKIPTPVLRHRRREALRSVATSFHPSYGRPPEISFCVDQINPWILAHEASHVAQHHLFNVMSNSAVKDHGPEFRDVYLSITHVFLGEQAAKDLKISFSRFTPPTPVIAGIERPNTNITEGILQKFRVRRQVENMNKVASNISGKINGAIPL